MKYMIESIGSEFSNRAISTLETRFTERASEGYRLHSVFPVRQPGCLGIGEGSNTYLAVYVKDE